MSRSSRFTPQSLELKIPPPIVALIVGLAMWGLSRVTVAMIGADAIRTALAVAFALTGAIFDVAALIAFRRARTTVNPLKPRSAASLVTSGIYQVTRNPMYVGLVFFLCAWAAWLGAWLGFLGPLVFGAYISRFQIAPEENALDALFGNSYRAYKAKVRRWL